MLERAGCVEDTGVVVPWLEVVFAEFVRVEPVPLAVVLDEVPLITGLGIGARAFARVLPYSAALSVGAGTGTLFLAAYSVGSLSKLETESSFETNTCSELVPCAAESTEAAAGATPKTSAVASMSPTRRARAVLSCLDVIVSCTP